MNLKSLIRDALSPFPAFYRAAFMLGARRTSLPLIVRKDTEIVIEGYARSANTYSVVAFYLSQKRPVKIGHHLHSIAQVLTGVKMGIPVIVLIRRPEDSVRSLSLIFRQDPNHELRRWLSFYRAVEKVRDHVVIAEFSDVIADFGAVVAKVNARWGTDFACFETNETTVAEVFAEIDRINIENPQPSDGGKAMYVARPTREKREARSAQQIAFEPALLAQAHALMARLTGKPGTLAPGAAAV
ncbi:hypothetical protein ACOYW6_01430 [Parablastomonas sp. CN1-191]|uniref:hypothetical protein n=1 Tax=Parablastomonas sp. CN1-191 TaxID=3400908 RepID=UPI003BF78D8E